MALPYRTPCCQLADGLLSLGGDLLNRPAAVQHQDSLSSCEPGDRGAVLPADSPLAVIALEKLARTAPGGAAAGRLARLYVEKDGEVRSDGAGVDLLHPIDRARRALVGERRQ